jgi:hypothetical protein
LSYPEEEKNAQGAQMPRSLAHHQVEISHLVHAYGITRDQARRLINRIGNNRAKLGEAARILKARLPSRSVSEAERPKERIPPEGAGGEVSGTNLHRVRPYSRRARAFVERGDRGGQRVDLVD